MSGQLQPGQRLTSRKPAKELGASDMPVRSAAIRLQAPGALSPMPKGSVEVPLLRRIRLGFHGACRYVAIADRAERT